MPRRATCGSSLTPRENICDGVLHCADKTDELNCPARGCNNACEGDCVQLETRSICTCQPGRYRPLRRFASLLPEARPHGPQRARWDSRQGGRRPLTAAFATHAGLLLRDDGRTCADVDECLDQQTAGGCRKLGGNCVNTRGGYECVCPYGYELQGAAGCQLIDPSEVPYLAAATR